MKELLVISGKGGTGKTSIVGGLALLAEDKLLADCDVAASNLHLLLGAEEIERENFYGSKLPLLDIKQCTGCGECRALCPTGAIDKDYSLQPLFCEGCLLCYHVCPERAISFKDRCSGQIFTSETDGGLLVHARLGIAEENSGLLVAEVKKKVRLLAEKQKRELIIVDGPPGIGCPVISALAEVDLVLIVTEPTVSGIHDLERVVQVAEQFEIELLVCINKHDLYPQGRREIEKFCQRNGLSSPVKVSFDPLITEAMVQGESILSLYPEAQASREIRKVWHYLQDRLGLNNGRVS